MLQAVAPHSLTPAAAAPLSRFFTNNQLCWAAGHDWFVGLSPSGYIVCRDITTLGDVVHIETALFSDFRAMRDWAGY